jgi:hypothetical protein
MLRTSTMKMFLWIFKLQLQDYTVSEPRRPVSEQLFLLLLLLLWLYNPLLGLGSFFSFLILYTVGRTPWTGDQPVARPLPTRRTTQTQKRKQTSMPRVGFELTIPLFERAKTVHALDRAATVIGSLNNHSRENLSTQLVNSYRQLK